MYYTYVQSNYKNKSVLYKKYNYLCSYKIFTVEALYRDYSNLKKPFVNMLEKYHYYKHFSMYFEN